MFENDNLCVIIKKNARESLYSAMGFEKKMSMETSSSEGFARHFILCYLNTATACLGFDQKSKKYAYNIIIHKQAH